MMNSTQANASGHEDGVDIISNLPDPILHLILSFLPTTEEVTQTSILSTRWRYLWASVPSIDIDYTRGLKPLQEFDKNKFQEFVYWVLVNRSLDLDSFRLCCSDYYSISTVGQWIHATVMRKVKLLDLEFFPTEGPDNVELPHCLVTCGSLEVLRLRLFGCRVSLPKLTGFPALRALELNDIELYMAFRDGNLVKYFLESCPLLEDLSLIDCQTDAIVISSPKLKTLRIRNREPQVVEDPQNYSEDWRMCEILKISCPKLVFLELTGYVALEILFDSLYSLKKAVIQTDDLFDYEDPLYQDPLYRFFDELSHVEFLSINISWIEMCYKPGIDDPISLPNLKTLELIVDDLRILIPFLTCLPDLESLYLMFPKEIYGLEEWKVDEGETIRILTRHLKKVEFLEFEGEKAEVGVARALLENGNEMEEMFFNWGNIDRFLERAVEIMKEVPNFHKASKKPITLSILLMGQLLFQVPF